MPEQLAQDYIGYGKLCDPIIENKKFINLQSSAYVFFPMLAFNHSQQRSLWASSPFGRVARSHSRAAHEDDASFAAPSPVLSRLVSLASWNGELARRLIYGASLKLPSLRVWTRTSGCKGQEMKRAIRSSTVCVMRSRTARASALPVSVCRPATFSLLKIVKQFSAKSLQISRYFLTALWKA